MANKEYRLEFHNGPDKNAYADVYADDEFIERFTGRTAVEKAVKKIENLQAKERSDGITVFNF